MRDFSLRTIMKRFRSKGAAGVLLPTGWVAKAHSQNLNKRIWWRYHGTLRFMPRSSWWVACKSYVIYMCGTNRLCFKLTYSVPIEESGYLSSSTTTIMIILCSFRKINPECSDNVTNIFWMHWLCWAHQSQMPLQRICSNSFHLYSHIFSVWSRRHLTVQPCLALEDGEN